MRRCAVRSAAGFAAATFTLGVFLFGVSPTSRCARRDEYACADGCVWLESRCTSDAPELATVGAVLALVGASTALFALGLALGQTRPHAHTRV